MSTNKNIYITGDTHRHFSRIHYFCEYQNTCVDDILIILGDAGINLALDERDIALKDELSEYPITLFCIHGNHEERPYHILTYKEMTWHGGVVYYEEKYPNLLFAKDGEIYDFNGKKCMAIGGAYSIDKYYRIAHNAPWFPSEQPSTEIKAYVEQQLDAINWDIDYIFSHTIPKCYEPTWSFKFKIDESLLDKSTELWLDDLEEKLTYKRWYAGHYHVDSLSPDIRLMFRHIISIDDDDVLYNIGDLVSFTFCDDVAYGVIEVRDFYGTCSQEFQVSYDIYNEKENMLYKHIENSLILPNA